MGIINITTDSFYGKSRVQSVEEASQLAQSMIHQGVDILDLGAASSRPGALSKSADEEWEQLSDVLREIVTNFPDIVVSVDTYHGTVASNALEVGAGIINDISGFEMDDRLINVLKDRSAAYVLMHMKGNPLSMQDQPQYSDVVAEVLQFFVKKLRILKDAGILDIIVDPGFGFGKTLDHNYELMRKLEIFKMLDHPILAGISRKSMIYKLLNITVEESLNATSALHLQALLNGANILRVHDVKEAKEVIQLYQKLKNN